MKGLINIENNENKCFFWCHIRHLNLVKIHPERITKEDRNIMILIMKELNFLFQKKDYYKIERQNNVCTNVFC